MNFCKGFLYNRHTISLLNLRTKEMKTDLKPKDSEIEVIDFAELDLEKAFDDLALTPTDRSKDTNDLGDLDLPADEEPEVIADNSDDVKDETTNTQKDSEEDSDDNLDKETKDAVDLSLVDELIQRLGLETDQAFDDNVDGLVSLAREASVQLAEQQLSTLFTEYPDLELYTQFRLNGGASELFFETMYPSEDYSTLIVGEDDTQLQERLVRKALVAMGQDEDDIKAAIAEFKASDILHSQAQRSLKGLVKRQSSEKEQLVKSQAQLAAQEAKDQDAYLKTVKDTITKSSDFRGVVVSEKDKGEFHSYVSNPVKNGQSQFQLDMEEAPMDIYLAIAALMKNGFDLSGIITRRATTLEAGKLRDRLKKNQDKLRSQSDDGKGLKLEVNADDLDLQL